MKYLIEIPDGCKFLLPETHGPIVTSMLTGGMVVKEVGYPRRLEPADDGVMIKMVADDVIDPNSEMAKANKKIESLLTTITKLKEGAVTEPL